MGEIIVVYHTSDLSVPIEIDRAEFYAQRQTVYRDYYKSVVDMLIFDPQGNIILQRRARNKTSPGLLHTTVGGHINPHETVDFTVLHECIEEFGYPSHIVEGMEFEQAYKTLLGYHNKIILLRPLRFWNLEYEKTSGESTHFTRDKCHDFIGVFGGEPNNLDGAVEAFETLSLKQLDERLREVPDDFTLPFRIRYQEFQDELYEFRDLLLSLSEKYTLHTKS